VAERAAVEPAFFVALGPAEQAAVCAAFYAAVFTALKSAHGPAERATNCTTH
jgi:hypothetical protein